MVLRVLAFDVNETLLDVAALDPLFEELLGDAKLRPQWFATMLQLAFVGGLTGQYVDFPSAQGASLAMTAARVGREVPAGGVEAVLHGMRRLPPHPDVAAALTRLREAGFVVTALTNSVLDAARDQLENAGLTDRFDAIFSADEVRSLKPSPAPYRMVAERTGVDIGDVCLVAAHAWDVSGAMAAGARTAFVGRSGATPSPLGDRPDVVGADLTEVADELLRG